MFYHSHVSHQRGDGNFGPYIVRQTPEDDPNSHLYDFDLTEHMIFPQEWFHEVSSMFLPISFTLSNYRVSKTRIYQQKAIAFGEFWS